MQNNNSDNSYPINAINLRDLITTFYNSKKIIIVLTLIFTLIFTGYSYTQKTMVYQSSAYLVVGLHDNSIDNIQIIDDPHILRGLGSRTFDGEGIESKKIKLVENGKLKSWLLSSQSARQLKLKSTGHSNGVSNLYLAPGDITNRALIESVQEGFYVTEMMGMSFNQVTGDYSRGATGFWIEKGEKTYPVSEVTIAGNIIDMYKMLTPASDLKLITGIDAPTIMIDKMIVAGL